MQNFDVTSLIPLITSLVTTWGLKLIGAVILLVVGRMAAGWVRRGVRKVLERSTLDRTLVPFLSGLVYYLVLAFVMVAVLGMVGIQHASLVAVFGAAGLAVGLALQGTLSHFAAGVMLLVFRPFRVGDFVEVSGQAGSVQAIGLFSTVLNTPDNVQITIPNSNVFGNTVKNYAANDTRRIDLVIGVSYDDDLEVASQTIRSVLDGDSRVLADPQPMVAVSELGDSSVNFVVRPWCRRQDYWDLRCALVRTLKIRIEAAGCSFPYPQQDVHMHQAAQPDAA
jgi:small conductance mechanosensitive channel